MNEPVSIAKPDFIEGAAKALAVLECFDVNRQRLNVTQAAERTGITRTAARRHLLTLAHLGYLETDGQHYWLSARVLRLAGSYLSSARLPRAIRPFLNELSQANPGTYCAAVLDEKETVIVATSGERWGSDDIAPFGAHLGSRMPAYCTSTGRIMLAARSPADVRRWLRDCEPVRLTAKTLTQKRLIEERITEGRRDGFCYAAEEHELGVHAIAVPLLDATGRCVAALNVVDYMRSTGADQWVKKLLPNLQRTATRLRAAL
jgi:IclR family transcriptional regulator, pca regulon regulatory protein